MFNFTNILSDLRAVIAARAARDRALTVLLVAVWGRIARMGARLERLVALWRAGHLPTPGAARAKRAPRASVPPAFPTAPAWLLRTLGYEVVAFGSQLQHMLTEAECRAFLAEVPQAGRVLRPLLRMLGVAPLPEEVRPKAVVVTAAAVPVLLVETGFVGGVAAPIFSGG